MWILATALLAAGGDVPSSISSDETVVFFPTYGFVDPQTDEWVAGVHGWIFEPSLRGRTTVATLRRLLGLEPDEKQAATFKRRATAFGVDNERGKVVAVRIAGNEPAGAGPLGRKRPLSPATAAEARGTPAGLAALRRRDARGR